MTLSPILSLSSQSVDYTLFGIEWLPLSNKFVSVGTKINSGIVTVYELDGLQISQKGICTTPNGIKTCTLGASSISTRTLATGNMNGNLNFIDLTTMKCVETIKAHSEIINSMDGAGGNCYGPPEIVTASRDGYVKVWDTRQTDRPVLSITPSETTHPDTWAVAFGHSFNDQERRLVSGYDNGDVKMFDMRTNKIFWETNVGNGVCGIEFDRSDIEMNKLVVTTLESTIHAFDVRTLGKDGFASAVEKLNENSTIWLAKHSPHNRDLFIASLTSHYPAKRNVKEKDEEFGVAGKLECIGKESVSEQPVSCLDWCKDKEGLLVWGAYDQRISIGFVKGVGRM